MAQAATSSPAAAKPVSAAAARARLIKTLRCSWRYEKEAWASGARFVAGVDEVGRGALFGPVMAAAVILDPSRRIRGLRDSKQLSANQREELAEEVRAKAVAVAVASVEAEQIDQINIYQASRLVMKMAVEGLAVLPEFLLVDAMRLDCNCAQRGIIHGDGLSVSIAAASIVAKVERDRLMCQLNGLYPQYGLASHKGYGTAMHLAALREHGPTELHRMTFAGCSPVQSG